MSTDGSITTCIRTLIDTSGLNEAAAKKIFERYFEQLQQIARKKIAGRRLHDRDEEDFAIEVLRQFFEGVRDGRFHTLDDRDDLWQVLLMILGRRLIDHYRKKPEPVVGESAFLQPGRDPSSDAGFVVPDPGPAPDEIAEAVEELLARLKQFPERGGFRQIALWKLEGRTNAEIARLLKRSEKRVERKLQIMRRELRRNLPDGLGPA